MIDSSDTHALERHILETIPLARAMDLSVVEFDGHRLALSAPLAPNVNDKGCAFGGSLVSLLTLTGWGLVNLKLAEADMTADVFVQDSTVVYLEPVWDEIVAEASAAADQSWDVFIEGMREKGKARIAVDAELQNGSGSICARFVARFVAKLKDPT